MGVLQKVLEWCRREVTSPRAATDFGTIGRDVDWRAFYPKPKDVVDLLGIIDGATDDLLARKDHLLQDLIAEFQAGRNLRILSATLILSFAPRLLALSDRYAFAAAGRDAAATDVLTAFLDAIATYPLAARPTKISANLAWETERRLAQSASRDRRRERAEQTLSELAPQLDLEGSSSGVDWSSHAQRAKRRRTSVLDADDIDDACTVLQRLEAAGVIDQLDRELIETTYVYRWNLRECVDAGLWGGRRVSYMGAHMRLHRAKKRIRYWLELQGRTLGDLLTRGDVEKK
jgi:hypothetical protein